MVREQIPDAVFCTNLYGEILELYREGCLQIPGDVILIWADNGYGKMVSRRQGNHNPRVSALPEEGDKGRHGTYYHVSFYDLQAANHITMLPNSMEFVEKELTDALRHGIRTCGLSMHPILSRMYILFLLLLICGNRMLCRQKSIESVMSPNTMGRRMILRSFPLWKTAFAIIRGLCYPLERKRMSMPENNSIIML